MISNITYKLQIILSHLESIQYYRSQKCTSLQVCDKIAKENRSQHQLCSEKETITKYFWMLNLRNKGWKWPHGTLQPSVTISAGGPFSRKPFYPTVPNRSTRQTPHFHDQVSIFSTKLLTADTIYTRQSNTVIKKTTWSLVDCLDGFGFLTQEKWEAWVDLSREMKWPDLHHKGISRGSVQIDGVGACTEVRRQAGVWGFREQAVAAHLPHQQWRRQPWRKRWVGSHR